jgi:hypothetical protein
MKRVARVRKAYNIRSEHKNSFFEKNISAQRTWDEM